MRTESYLIFYNVNTGRQTGSQMGLGALGYEDRDGVLQKMPDGVIPEIEDLGDRGYRDPQGNRLEGLLAVYRLWVDDRNRPIVPQPDRAFP